MKARTKRRDVSVQTSESSWGGKWQTLLWRGGMVTPAPFFCLLIGQSMVPSSRQATEAIKYGKGVVNGSYVSSEACLSFRTSAFLDTFAVGLEYQIPMVSATRWWPFAGDSGHAGRKVQ